MVAKEGHQTQVSYLGRVMMLSAWGFVIVITSVLFLYLGYKLDTLLGTAPNFMLGLFMIAVVTTIGRFFREAWHAGKI